MSARTVFWALAFAVAACGGAAAHESFYSREEVIHETPEWKGERFPDGRPRVPDAILDRMKSVPLEEAWAEMTEVRTMLVLDNYEATTALGTGEFALTTPVGIVIGGERGWEAAERDFFRRHGASLAHLGPRVLRTETACVAAVAIVRSRL